jgi:cellulose synthase/poly-beta-1,6-N-acetylglucosamine synthase-like glycosyltransferase
VAERQSEEQRGKGYALAHGRSVLAADPPSVVIVVDADAIVQPGSVEALARVAVKGVPAQAVYLMVSDGPAPPIVQISNFAFLVKNMVRVRALGRIGRCALLTGSGMAFSWDVFAAAPLASGEITEDLNLGIALTRTFKAAKLVEQAVVLSEAAAFEASAQQRQRWEHGFLDNATRNALPLLWDGVSKGSRAMVALGLHLLVPPLALLMILSAAIWAVLIGVGLIWSVWAPAVALSVLLTAAVLLTIAAWSRYGREMVSAKALARVPLYVLWKLPLYARFLVKREKSWVRTRRTGES